MPRRGSLQFYPRKRASTEIARFRSWPEVDGPPRLIAFPGYKVGMMHFMVVEDRPGSPLFGREVFTPVTIIETPPVMLLGVRAYTKTVYGLQHMATAMNLNPRFEIEKEKLPDSIDDETYKRLLSSLKTYRDKPDLFMRDLSRRITVPKELRRALPEKVFDKLESEADQIAELRAIVCTLPRLVTGVPKKAPEILEIPVKGGSMSDRVKYMRQRLGYPLFVQEVFTKGQFVDVTAVTRGKGFQGVIKRFGVKRLPHKAGKRRREVGSLGSRHPAKVCWTVPRPGQLGYFKRTEYNKRILEIGLNGEDITPKGGFHKYGIIRTQYVVIKGSTPGPVKRFTLMRYPIRISPLPYEARYRITWTPLVGG